MSGKLNLLHSNDKKGVFPPSWYAATAQAPQTRPSLSGDMNYDVCIIGAGYTGLSSALHLAKRGFKVVVLEAHRAGWGASGRNGGQVGSGQRMDQQYLEKHYGLDAAKAYWQIAEEAKLLVRELISQHSIDCKPIDGIIYADHRARYGADTKAYVELLAKRYGYDQIRSLDRDALRQYVKSESYFGGSLDEGAFHIHPLEFAFGLAKAAEEAGAKIHELSEVMRVEKGRKVQVVTSAGRITADHLIIGCNGYLGDLVPKTAERVLPINNFIVVTEPLSDDFRQQIMPGKAAIADSKFVVNYFRMTHDQRMLFGGGENYGYRFPSDIKSFVQKPMLEIFPQLKNTRIDYGWGGTLAITLKRLPLFQRVSHNILNMSGYSGHGVALATMAGKIAGEAVAGQAGRFDLMSQLETPRFPGGTKLRHPLLVLAMSWFSIRDKF